MVVPEQLTEPSAELSASFRPRGGRYGDDTDAWMRAIRPRLIALARRFLWNTHDAEEMAQEALMLAWKNAGQLNEPHARNAWIYRTAINLCISRLRRKRPQSALPDELASSDDDPSEAGTVSELAARVRAAISELPELLRVALVLRDLEGLDYKQMSAIVQSRPSTLRLRVYQARETIRQTLIHRWPDSFGTDK